MKTKYPRSNAPAGNVFKIVRSRAKSPRPAAARAPRASGAHFKPLSFGPFVNPTTHLTKILVAIDFSDESKKVLQYAAAFARQSRASITALHVVEPIACQADYGYGTVIRSIPNLQQLRKARSRLKALSKRVLGSSLKFEPAVRSGVAHEEITQAARDFDSDLIVIGTRGDATTKHRPMGSTAEKVVRHAPCPVLVVRKKEHEFVWCRKSR